MPFRRIFEFHWMEEAMATLDVRPRDNTALPEVFELQGIPH